MKKRFKFKYMNTLKMGSHEPDVLYIQKYLGLTIDGIFGEKTFEAVKKWQSDKDLLSDGIIGPKSWSIILGDTRKSLEDTDYQKLADELGIEVATIKAVKSVESGTSSFGKIENRPVILFESRLFKNDLKRNGIDSSKYNLSEIESYQGGEKEWKRLYKAFRISPKFALRSASYGMFQILGSNFSMVGCKDVYEYIARMYYSEKEHLNLFGKFLQSSGLVKYLKTKDWASFAKGYNGKNYAQNSYDKKLRDAYAKYSK